MKTSRLLAIAALSMIATLGAQAETYDGVLKSVSVMSRSEVNAEGVRAASAPNQNVTRGSRGADAFTSTATRAAVMAQAERVSFAPDQNISAGSRVDSKVISTMQNSLDSRDQRAANPAQSNVN